MNQQALLITCWQIDCEIELESNHTSDHKIRCKNKSNLKKNEIH